MTIALWQLLTRTTSGSSNDSGAYEQRLEDYKKQMQAVEDQWRHTAEMQTRSVHLLDVQERLLTDQERQLKRFDAILNQWEKLPAR